MTASITYDLVVVGNPHYNRFVSPLLDTKDRVLSGSAANVFRVAAHLGVEQAAIVGCLGDDFRAEFLQDLSDYPFAESVLLPSKATGGFEVDYSDGDSESLQVIGLANRIRISDFPAELLKSRIVLMTPSHREIDVEFIDWLSGATNARIILDPRGLLQKTTNGGKIELVGGNDLLEEIVGLVHQIQVNEKEAEALTGQSDLFVAVEMLVENGCDTAVVTMGEKGSILFDGSDFVIFPSFESVARDCTIAGDAFLAAFASQMLNGYNHLDSGIFATCTASILI